MYPQAFKSINPVGLIQLFLLTFLLKFYLLTGQRVPYQNFSGSYVFQLLVDWLSTGWGLGAFAFNFLAIICLLVQALVLNRIVNQARLYTRNTYLPAMSYIVCSALIQGADVFSDIMVANFMVIAAFAGMLTLNNSASPRRQVFYTGMLLALAALICPPAIILMGLLLAAVAITRPFVLAEYVAAIMGYLTPFYFLAAWWYITDRINLFPRLFSFKFTYPTHLPLPEVWVGLGLFVVLLALGSFRLRKGFLKMLIQVRKNWLVVNVYLIFSVLEIFIIKNGFFTNYLVLLPATSLIAVFAFNHEKKKKISNFTYFIITGCILAIQYLL